VIRNHTVQQGQWTAARFAGEAYVGASYSLTDETGYNRYSANPADYWNAEDDVPVGPIIRNSHRFRTVTGRIVFAERLIKTNATLGDLRRLARAATHLVIPGY
jgi:hypothetical protein